MTAPLKLTVRGPVPPPDTGQVTLNIELLASEPLGVPVKLSVALPAEAKITKGAAEETLQITQAGQTTREVVLQLSGKLSSPVVVVAEAHDDGGGFGLRAEKKYPAEPPPGVSGQRPPPMRPPAPPH